MIFYYSFLQFIELYNEEIIDLFDQEDAMTMSSTSLTATALMTNDLVLLNGGAGGHVQLQPRAKIEIHEDQHGGIFLNGCSTRAVRSLQEVRVSNLKA